MANNPLADPREQKPEEGGLGVMEGRISRFREMPKRPMSLMFIGSPLPHHQRLNYAVIGDVREPLPETAPAPLSR